MYKHDIIRQLAKKSGISLKDTEHFFNLMIDHMVKALQQNERIEIRGFGNLTVRTYESYSGRNPKTGAAIVVPGKRLPFFKAGKDLLDRINK